MTMNSGEANGALLAPDDILKVKAKLFAMLKKQVQRYTMGESTSIPGDTAQRLLHSACFCLGISDSEPDASWARLVSLDVNDELKIGQQKTAEKAESCKRLWLGISAKLPPIENDSMFSTLKSIGSCWKRYDIRFFAAELDCDIDYQLALPVPESLQSVDYVGEYLRRLNIENSFLSLYGAQELIPVLTKYCGDYKGLLINLFEPVFSNALAIEILGRTGGGLMLSRAEPEKLCRLIDNMRRIDIEKLLISASGKLAQRVPTDDAAEYFSAYCAELAVRMDKLRDTGGMSGIFQTE